VPVVFSEHLIPNCSCVIFNAPEKQKVVNSKLLRVKSKTVDGHGGCLIEVLLNLVLYWISCKLLPFNFHCHLIL